MQEYFEEDSWSNAYLLFVDRPKNSGMTKTFRIVMQGLGNGDQGEASYTLEEQNDYIWPEGEINIAPSK